MSIIYQGECEKGVNENQGRQWQTDWESIACTNSSREDGSGGWRQ